MALKNGFLETKNGSVDVSSSNYAEIHVHRAEGSIVSSKILVRFPGNFVSYRDEISIDDIEILEDFFIDHNVNYFIINN